MPFKDIATSDSILLREVPPADDKPARQALRRMAVRRNNLMPAPSCIGHVSVPFVRQFEAVLAANACLSESWYTTCTRSSRFGHLLSWIMVGGAA